MEYKHLLISEEARVATVCLNRPEKGNSLAPEVLSEIAAVFTELSSREDVHVVVLTGGERYFCAGFDLDEIRKLKKGANEEFISLFNRAYRSILHCSQPVICAIGGPAIAGGFDLRAVCDSRYASERAKFGQRETALSLIPILDPLWRIIGLGRAKEVALTGRIYDAWEAERMGFVSKVFAEGELLSAVDQIARDMAAFDRACLQETKQMGHMILDRDSDDALRLHEWLFRSYIGSEENHRRIDALQAELAARKKK